MNRRKALKLAALAGVTAAPAASAQDKTALKVGQLDACEGLLGFDLNPHEQHQALGLLEGELDSLRAMKAMRFKNEEAPALTFDPRLPGRALRTPLKAGKNEVQAPPLPSNAEDIAFASLLTQAAWIKTREITSLELAKIYLERIETLDPRLKCFITVTASLAREQAAKADALLAKGTYLGPLHGIPYGLKDLADTAGITTSWGAEITRTRVPSEDSVVYKRLRAAGAVLLGKTTLGALAYGDQWFGGKTLNPWNLNEGSSGSSAGSASGVGAGLMSFAIGSETMGSIVSPADRTGCAGLRPTFGRVARTGAMALCWSLDKLGPLTRTIADTAPILAAINGPDAGDPSFIDMPFVYDLAASTKGAVIGYDPAWFEGAAAHDVDRAALKAAKGLDITFKEISLPDLPYGRLGPILMTEAAAAFEEITLDNTDDTLVWQGEYAWPNSFRAAQFYPAVTLVQLDRLRRRVMEAMDDVMADVDVLLHPSYAANLLQIGNYTGRPTAVLRGGFIEQPTRTLFEDDVKPEGNEAVYTVPRSICLTGHLFDEARLIAIASAIEAAIGETAKRPAL